MGPAPHISQLSTPDLLLMEHFDDLFFKTEIRMVYIYEYGAPF